MERLPNNQIQAMLRKSKADEELAKAIKSGAGKLLATENDRAEKIAGGKKKLDAAAKVLVDAETAYGSRVEAGDREAVRLVADANGAINQAKAGLAERGRVLDQEAAKIERRKITLDERDRAAEESLRLIKERQDTAEARGMELDRRESEVRTREATVSESEAKRVEYERWQSERPVHA